MRKRSSKSKKPRVAVDILEVGTIGFVSGKEEGEIGRMEVPCRVKWDDVTVSDYVFHFTIVPMSIPPIPTEATSVLDKTTSGPLIQRPRR